MQNLIFTFTTKTPAGCAEVRSIQSLKKKTESRHQQAVNDGKAFLGKHEALSY